MAGKKKGPSQSVRIGIGILRGNRDHVLVLMSELGYNAARLKDVEAGLDWLENVLLEGG